MKSVEDDPSPGLPEGDLLTSPFDLVSRISSPRFRIDSIAFVDIGLIALITLFLSQSFLFSPGVSIDLPTFENGESLTGVQAGAVATVWNEKIVTTLGSYPIERMGNAFADLKAKSMDDNRTLLLLIDGSTSLESMGKIYESAQGAGYDQIQMAARVPAPAITP